MDTKSHWCESLYEGKAAQLVLYGRALGLSHSEAEDVLQETFMALLQQEERPEKPLHYCLRSFRNRALNYRRSLWRRLAREIESKQWFERAEGATAQERAAMRCLAKIPRSGFADPSAYRLTPTFALSNLDFATYFAAASQKDHNIVQTTFEWTNGGRSMTTPPSFFDRNRYRE